MAKRCSRPLPFGSRLLFCRLRHGPLVGTLPGRPNVYVAAGFNGHGMPQCFGVGKAVALLLSGREEEMNAYVREVVRADRVVG